MDTQLHPAIDHKEYVTTPRDTRDFHGLALDEDVSLLRQPMTTALTGFLEAKKAYENGTDEVRRLLIHECSLIYECKACRNMFRSLVNFISHKRIYCKLSFEANNYRSYSDQNPSLIIQTTEQQMNPWVNKSRSTGSSPVPRKTSTRDLSKIIERLKRVDVSNELKCTKEEKPASAQSPETLDGGSQLEAQEKEKILLCLPTALQNKPSEEPDPVLQLERVPTSTHAVYQTLNPLHATDSIRTEVDEVHNLLVNNQQNTMVGPDGKAVAANQGILINADSFCTETPTLTALLREANASAATALGEAQQISCELCQMQFQTEKTLNIHIQKKHTSSTYVFQCPTCSLTFLQPAAVIRHLANEHKKPLKRIRKMRDTILKKRIQIGDVQTKGPSRELKRLQMDTTKESLANAHGCQTPRQLENGKPISRCSHCQGTFEKRAAFVTHLANCSAKNKSSIKDVSSSLKEGLHQNQIRVATADEIETKLQNQISHMTTTLGDNDENVVLPHAKEIKIIDQALMDSQASMMAMMTSSSQEIEMSIKNYEFEYLTQNLSKVKIKQEPQEDEFNSTSTHATTGSDINEMFENLERQTFGEGLQTVSLDLMVASEEQEVMGMEREKLSTLTPPNEKEEDEECQQDITDNPENMAPVKYDQTGYSESYGEVTNTEQPLKPLNAENVAEKKKQKGFRTVPASKQLTCRCKICNKQFNALSNLRRHISMFHYRARRFGCNLCEYRAFRRYDIVNHLTFVHKMQGERESMAVEFVTMHEIPYSKDDVEHDIVVVQEAVENAKVSESFKVQANGLKTYENKAKRKNQSDSADYKSDSTGALENMNEEGTSFENTLPKVVRKRLRRSLTKQDDSGVGGQRRPIRNRIKPVNNDFVYDLSALKEEPKDALTRVSLKRRNTMGMEVGSKPPGIELTPPIKITPYRLRTEPLIPASKDSVKGTAARTYRNVVHEAMAAPSTLPEIPAERPQMRPRLSMAFRSDSSSTPVIEATELEVARLESTFFDDSFLEKFAKKSNPSFKMKPLFSLQHSPLNSILQKFENNSTKSLLNSSSSEESPMKLQENGVNCSYEERVTRNSSTQQQPFDSTETETETESSLPTTVDFVGQATIDSISAELLEQFETSPPNGKHIMEPSSPPSTPRKRITLMQRLAENRAKRRDTVLRSSLEN